MITDAIEEALWNLNWEYITLSPYSYSKGHYLAAFYDHWQERVFAYELYHQLRLIWDSRKELRDRCIIQGEVRKGYQKIAKFDKMPDFIFHQRKPGANHAVVEMKLATCAVDMIERDFTKLVLFQQILKYQELVEIFCGKKDDFESRISGFTAAEGHPIEILFLSTEDRKVTRRQVRFMIE